MTNLDKLVIITRESKITCFQSKYMYQLILTPCCACKCKSDNLN